MISWNIHMSDPDKDVENAKRKGTPEYDRLFRLRPLMDSISEARKALYHPRRNLSVSERVVASKAQTEFKQSLRSKKTKWGFKPFVLADSSNGSAWDLSSPRAWGLLMTPSCPW